MNQLVPASWKDSFDRLRSEVDAIFERWLPIRGDSAQGSVLDFPWPVLRGPAVDIHEDDDAIHVEAELPGLSPEEFKVELVGRMLTLRGERKREQESTKAGYRHIERSHGSFARTIELPCEVNEAAAKAVYENGVLKISLPKSELAKARRIPVNVAQAK